MPPEYLDIRRAEFTEASDGTLTSSHVVVITLNVNIVIHSVELRSRSLEHGFGR